MALNRSWITNEYSTESRSFLNLPVTASCVCLPLYHCVISARQSTYFNFTQLHPRSKKYVTKNTCPFLSSDTIGLMTSYLTLLKFSTRSCSRLQYQQTEQRPWSGLYAILITGLMVMSSGTCPKSKKIKCCEEDNRCVQGWVVWCRTVRYKYRAVQKELSRLMVGTAPTMDGSRPGDAM